MEALGHQKAMQFLLTTGMIITTFVSDRHATITKWMRETCPKMCKELGKPVIKHFFDLWHIGKSIFDLKYFSQYIHAKYYMFCRGSEGPHKACQGKGL